MPRRKRQTMTAANGHIIGRTGDWTLPSTNDKTSKRRRMQTANIHRPSTKISLSNALPCSLVRKFLCSNKRRPNRPMMRIMTDTVNIVTQTREVVALIVRPLVKVGVHESSRDAQISATSILKTIGIKGASTMILWPYIAYACMMSTLAIAVFERIFVMSTTWRT